MQRGAGGKSAALQHAKLPLSYSKEHHCKTKLVNQLGTSRSLPALTQLPSRVLAQKPLPPSASISRASRSFVLSRTIGTAGSDDTHRLTLRERLELSDRLCEGLKSESLAKLDVIAAERGPGRTGGPSGWLPRFDCMSAHAHKFRTQDLSVKTWSQPPLPGPLQPEEDFMLEGNALLGSSNGARGLPAAAESPKRAESVLESALESAEQEGGALASSALLAELEQQPQQQPRISYAHEERQVKALLQLPQAGGQILARSPQHLSPQHLSPPAKERSRSRSKEPCRLRSQTRSKSPRSRSPPRSTSPPRDRDETPWQPEPWRTEATRSSPRGGGPCRPTSGRAGLNMSVTQTEPLLPTHVHRVAWNDTFWLEEIPLTQGASTDGPESSRRRRKPHPGEKANGQAERHRAPGAAANASAAVALEYARQTRTGPVLLNSSEAALARKQLLSTSASTGDLSQSSSRWRLRSLEKNSLRSITISRS